MLVSGEGDGWYLAGVNFNGRPWMPVHTYAAYAYDSAARRLVFAEAVDVEHPHLLAVPAQDARVGHLSPARVRHR